MNTTPHLVAVPPIILRTETIYVRPWTGEPVTAQARSHSLPIPNHASLPGVRPLRRPSRTRYRGREHIR